MTGTTYTDSTAVNGTTYYYVVSAVNGGGESLDSAQAAATPQPPTPGAPTGLTPTPGNTQVGLSWIAPSGTVTSYNVKRATVSSGPYTTISTAGAVTGTSYTDTGLVNGTTYYYVVSAVNGGGQGPDSAQAAATPDLSGATYVALTPARLLDSRFGNGLSGPFSPNAPRTFQVTGRGGVPANAVAVTGNLTVTEQTDPGFIFLGPDPVANPTSSTLNFPVGDTRANGVTVALGSGGTLSATYSGSGTTQLVFDVTGYFVPDLSGATYVALTPARLLDSRSGNGLSGPFSPNAPRTFQVTGRGGVPANAVAVTGNLTVTEQTDLGFIFLGPDPVANPTSSTLNFPVGDNRANGVTVALGSGGTLSATYGAASGTTQLIFDVTGYFVPDLSGATYVALTPARLLDSRSGNGLSGPFSPECPAHLPGDRPGRRAGQRRGGDRQPDGHRADRRGLRLPRPRPGGLPDQLDPQLPGRRHPCQRGHRRPRLGRHPERDLLGLGHDPARLRRDRLLPRVTRGVGARRRDLLRTVPAVSARTGR